MVSFWGSNLELYLGLVSSLGALLNFSDNHPVPLLWKSPSYNLRAVDIISLNVLQLQNPGPFGRKLVYRDGRESDNYATFVTSWFPVKLLFITQHGNCGVIGCHWINKSEVSCSWPLKDNGIHSISFGRVPKIERQSYSLGILFNANFFKKSHSESN